MTVTTWSQASILRAVTVIGLGWAVCGSALAGEISGGGVPPDLPDAAVFAFSADPSLTQETEAALTLLRDETSKLQGQGQLLRFAERDVAFAGRGANLAAVSNRHVLCFTVKGQGNHSVFRANATRALALSLLPQVEPAKPRFFMAMSCEPDRLRVDWQAASFYPRQMAKDPETQALIGLLEAAQAPSAAPNGYPTWAYIGSCVNDLGPNDHCEFRGVGQNAGQSFRVTGKDAQAFGRAVGAAGVEARHRPHLFWDFRDFFLFCQKSDTFRTCALERRE